MKTIHWIAVLFVSFMALSIACADEGMWLYNQFPKKMLKEKHGFEPTDEWLKHVRLSSVRFNSGGAGSFVSSNGLVMRNHHVGAGALQKLSTADRDPIKKGFYAKTQAEEGKGGGLERNGLLNE